MAELGSCGKNAHFKYKNEMKKMEVQIGLLNGQLREYSQLQSGRTSDQEVEALKRALAKAMESLEDYGRVRRENVQMRESLVMKAGRISVLNADLQALRRPYEKSRSALAYYEQSMLISQQRLNQLVHENELLRQS